MKAIYRISDKAVKDLHEIWQYTFQTWSKEQADRYYNLLLDEIEYIAIHFENGRSAEHIQKGYKFSKVKSHLIFYKKNKYEVIEIIRILHQRMDIKNKLK